MKNKKNSMVLKISEYFYGYHIVSLSLSKNKIIKNN